MNKKQKMYEQIKKHGDTLKAIFKLDVDSVKLCKQLFRLENKAHQLAEDGCNGVIYDTEPQAEKILKKVGVILNITDVDQIFFNGDPRGYALKFTSEFSKKIEEKGHSIHRDWGGYGIIAPNFREN